MPTIQDTVKKMIELEGLDVFKEPRKFFAYLDDFSPEYPRERRIIKNNFDDKLLGLFIDDTKKVDHRLRLIREELEYLGCADDKIYFIIESVGIPLGWEQEILDLKADLPTQAPNYNNQSKKQEVVNDSVTDVPLNDDFLKLLGFINKNLIPSVLNIPPTYRPPLSDITYRVTKIEDEVFKGCDKLQFVTIPDTVTEIGKSAFENCRYLEKINISETVTKIGDRAFTNCKSLKDVIITNSITEIGKSAFAGCSSLVSIHIPNKIIRISEGLFGKCKSLVNITIPNGVTEIEDLAFADCESLNSVLISKTVTKIGSRAFANCKSLESILIPNSVIDIVDEEAFGGCVKLQQFTLPTRFTIFKDYVNKQVDLKTNVKIFATAKVGDVVKFGNYPQSANGDVQPIEWQVLAKENNKMLVISKYGLEARRFDSSSNNWKTSEIRNWVYNEFYNKAFNEQEKKYINSSNLSDVGTTDNVFFLSSEEAKKYFANDNVRRVCKATDYAKARANVAANGYSYWWLRSPFPNHSSYVYYVDIGGDI